MRFFFHSIKQAKVADLGMVERVFSNAVEQNLV